MPNKTIKPISEAEGHVHILRGIISYHERMNCLSIMDENGNEVRPSISESTDIFLAAMRYALTAVEEKIRKELNPHE